MTLRRSALLLLLVLPVAPASGRDYVVSATGDDSRPGSAAEPWRTLAKVNATSLQPGDRVLLEGGRTFVGPLVLGSDDRGTPARNIVVTSYGDGRAVIDGGKGRAITVDGCDHVLLQRLKLVGAGRKTGNTDDGLYLAHSTGSTVDQVEVTGFRHSGVEISGTQDARITNVHAHQNGYAGINSGGDLSRNLYIGYCLTENNPGDPAIRDNHSGSGIIVSKVEVALVEYCESTYNGWDQPWTGNGPVGIWTHNADRVTIQHCISHHNRSTASDGGGFDFDGGVTELGPAVQLLARQLRLGLPDLPVRGRAAVRQQRGALQREPGRRALRPRLRHLRLGRGRGHGEHPGPQQHDLEHQGLRRRLRDQQGARGRAPRDRVLQQHLRQPGAAGLQTRRKGSGRSALFRGNLYWAMGERGFRLDGFKSLAEWAAASGQETVDGKLAGLFADPALPRSGPAMLTNPADLHRLVEYQLTPGSPAVGAGLDLRKLFGIDPGPVDFYGNPLPSVGPPSIGAHEPRTPR